MNVEQADGPTLQKPGVEALKVGCYVAHLYWVAACRGDDQYEPMRTVGPFDSLEAAAAHLAASGWENRHPEGAPEVWCWESKANPGLHAEILRVDAA